MPLTILVTDDNIGTRLSISDYLKTLGYFVIMAQNGQEALSSLDRYHPHLLIADINMPKMDGYELVQQVRSKPAFRLLPVVFLTERGTTEERIKGYLSGCDIYLPKPFEMQELAVVIRALLERVQIIQAEVRILATEQHLPVPATDRPTSTPDRPTRETISLPSNTLNLTKREQQVLHLLTQGLSNNKIGEKLHLSSRTIEKYVSSIFRKTQTSNRSEVVRFAMEHHLVD